METTSFASSPPIQTVTTAYRCAQNGAAAQTTFVTVASTYSKPVLEYPAMVPNPAISTTDAVNTETATGKFPGLPAVVAIGGVISLVAVMAIACWYTQRIIERRRVASIRLREAAPVLPPVPAAAPLEMLLAVHFRNSYYNGGESQLELTQFQSPVPVQHPDSHEDLEANLPTPRLTVTFPSTLPSRPPAKPPTSLFRPDDIINQQEHLAPPRHSTSRRNSNESVTTRSLSDFSVDSQGQRRQSELFPWTRRLNQN